MPPGNLKMRLSYYKPCLADIVMVVVYCCSIKRIVSKNHNEKRILTMKRSRTHRRYLIWISLKYVTSWRVWGSVSWGMCF